MKIELTDKEYRTLVDTIEMADWVLTGFEIPDEEDPNKQHFKALFQKIYALADKTGMKNLIEYDKKYKQYMPTSQYEEETVAKVYIEEFEELSFWHELRFRLAQKDCARLMAGKKPKTGKEVIDYMMQVEALEEQYEDEFDEYGLEHVTVKMKG